MRITNINTIANAIFANAICGASVKGLSMLRVSMDLHLSLWLQLRPSVGSAKDFVSRRLSGVSDLLRNATAFASRAFQPTLKQLPGNTGCSGLSQILASLTATPCYATASKPTGLAARTGNQSEMRFERPAFRFQKPC